jgi:hypothetical protein
MGVGGAGFICGAAFASEVGATACWPLPQAVSARHTQNVRQGARKFVTVINPIAEMRLSASRQANSSQKIGESPAPPICNKFQFFPTSTSSVSIAASQNL